MEMHRRKSWHVVAYVLACVAALVGFYALSKYNYLLYHSAVELFAVSTAAAIFTIGWNSRFFARNNLLLVLAVGYLAVGLLDLLHTLSYGGMGVFPESQGDMGIQLWIAARSTESLTLLAGAVVLGREWRIKAGWLLAIYGAVLAGLVLSIVGDGPFPVTYVPGEGLTPFKIASEYAIAAILIAAGLLLWHKRGHLNRRILALTIASVAATVLSELSFTLYVDLFGFWNFVGHILKLTSFILIYLALVQGSLLTPYDSLFRDLRESRESLEEELGRREHAEARLRVAMSELERSNAELERFAYVASHDLQEPLRKVLAFGERLESRCGESLGEKGKDYLQRMESAAERMSRLIKDLLELSRVTTRGEPFARVDLQELADEVVADLEVQIERTGGRVTVGDLPSIEADGTQIRQLLQNLVGNALKFHREGVPPRVEIEGEIVSGGEGGDVCRLRVSDNGIGFKQKDEERIFEVFQRLHARDKYDGTGIGLATCRRIVQRHGGQIEARSEPGEGSVFIITLPVEQPRSSHD